MQEGVLEDVESGGEEAQTRPQRPEKRAGERLVAVALFGSRARGDAVIS